jgi:general stress protein 26
MTPEAKKAILEFLKKCPIASLSTCSKKGEPESSAVYYHVDEEMNFYFMTKEFTRKSQNLIENPQVALLFYSQEDLKTLQLEGKAKKLSGRRGEDCLR